MDFKVNEKWVLLEFENNTYTNRVCTILLIYGDIDIEVYNNTCVLEYK